MLIVLKRFLWAKQSLTVLKIWPFFHTHCFQEYSNSEDLVFIIKIVYNIVQTPRPLLFESGGSKFCWLPPPEGRIWKIRKRRWKYGAGAGFLKSVWVCMCVWRGEGRRWHVSYVIFSRFIIYTHRDYITLCKTVLWIWRKTIFFCHHNFMKKLSKNEPENIP